MLILSARILRLAFVLAVLLGASTYGFTQEANAEELATNSHPTIIRYFQNDSRYLYRIALLELALTKTVSQFGPFILRPSTDEISQARGIALLKAERGVDIAFLPTSKERESTMQAVRIPILRGILGYRVLLIHRDLQPKFAKIQSLDDLRKDFVGGFGSQWADMAILQSNKLNVTGVALYDSLFSMLAYRRFDYFPRGLNEAWKELEERSTEFPNLAVEDTIALYYPYPVYFFVQHNNHRLAERIQEGLTKALEDGSFRALFRQYHESFQNRVKLSQRRVFILDNPTLPEDTPAIDTSWWLEELKGASTDDGFITNDDSINSKY
ncbi:amino acid ABC transporter substrate-binding protein [Hahella sp. CCB-MM4]|uniref:amino acid ABC transporter substrate-binding protein n=1 Tax=Hahella sp. (strain CCB-MM4) TaxID=1926491 RepID=UPI00114053D0|nr:amino acid ABC transporter substrate-binding protein [Hahella sp. CCB-MM4]